MENVPPVDELSAVLARLSQQLISEETVTSALHRVTALIKETISTTDSAGVTLVDEHGGKITAAATDRLAERADALQYKLNEGPCLAAWASRALVRIDEITTDRRWPRWCQAVEPLGLRSCLSAPLVAGDM